MRLCVFLFLTSKNGEKAVDIVYKSVHKLILKRFGTFHMWITISDFRF